MQHTPALDVCVLDTDLSFDSIILTLRHTPAPDVCTFDTDSIFDHVDMINDIDLLHTPASDVTS